MPKRTPRRPARPRGSVYWHTASERWCAQTPPDRRGRRRSKYFSEDQEQAAWAWLSTQLDALNDGASLGAGTERLGDYLNRWVTREKANQDRDWAPNTAKLYEWAVKRISEHRYARTAVADLTPDAIDQVIADLSEDLSRGSLKVIRSLLRSTLSDLADDGVIIRNPVRRRRIRNRTPATEAPTMWSEADTRKFLATAAVHSTRPALWWLVASCGLRSGEVRSLKLSDVNLTGGTLTFWRQKSRRWQTLELPTNVIDALRDHLSRQRSIGGLLFPPKRGRLLQGHTLVSELRRLRVLAAVPPLQRVHDLRHLAGSLMLANGYPVPTVAAILGHTPDVLMKVYAHDIPKHVVQAPRNMAAVLPWIGSKTTPDQSAASTPSPSAVRSAVLEPVPTPGTGPLAIFTGS